MDIQALFEQSTVPEILSKLEETRKNIEKEREELRIMVSERYRDLIEAADSIVDMQKCAEQICQHVQHIESECSHLQHQGLIGFKGRDDNDIARQDRKRRLYDIGARVKLLMDMPETLWLRVERKEMLTAALLHMLAQYIFTGLQVERLQADGQRVMKQFPVVMRQWTAIQRFRSTILSGCHSTVRGADLQQLPLVVSTLVAVALLEGTAARAALTHLLRQRADAVLAALRPDAVDDTVGRQVACAARLLLHTLQLVYALFCGGNELNSAPDGLFLTRLREVVASQKPFDLVDDHGSVAMRHLSADIKNYIPAVTSSEAELPAAEIRQLVKDWLERLLEQLQPRVAKLLESVPSVKGLSQVRDGVYTVLMEDEHRQLWPAICQQLAETHVSIWELFLRETIVARADQHIHQGLTSAFSQLTDSLSYIVEKQERLRSSVNVVDFRWSDVSEMPSTSGWMNYRRRNQQTLPGLVLRSRGHSAVVQELCAALDGRLAHLLTDVCAYTIPAEPGRPALDDGLELRPPSAATAISTTAAATATATATATAEPFDKWADSCRLAETLRAGTRRQVVSLVSELERLSTSAEAEDAAVLLTRIARAVIDLCPHVPLCLDASTRGKQASSAGRPLWEELVQQLLRVRPRLMAGWCQARAARLDADVTAALQRASDVDLSDFALWAAVTISEEADSGEQLESVVRVPRCPRLSLTSALYGLSTDISRLGSMTLGREVQNQLVQTCVRQLVDVYWRHVATRPASLSQHQALQALFDVHFLKSLASARDQELSKKISLTCEAIEEHIDPFDLNVSWPHAVKNLRQFAQHSQSLLGALSVDRGPVRSLTGGSSSQQEPHCLLALSARPVRFSLLAVPDPEPLERSRAATTSKATPPGSPKKAETIKPSPSFLAGLGSSWF